MAAKKRVLIVEDDASSRSALRLVLARQGWQVETAATLSEGFEQLRRGAFDSVVLDLMLPDGNGEDLLAHLRSSGQQTRVAVTTGVMDSPRLDRVRAMSPQCMLIKPIGLQELLRHL